MDIVGKVIPACAAIPDLDHLTAVLVQGDQALACVSLYAVHGGEIRRLGADPFGDCAGLGRKHQIGLLGEAQRGFALRDGNFLAVPAIELGEEHHHQAGDGKHQKEGDDVERGIKVPAPGGKVEFFSARP